MTIIRLVDTISAMCRFEGTPRSNADVKCIRARAIQRMRAGVEEIYSPTDIVEEVCHSSDSDTRQQCPAYVDLLANGRSSEWSK